MSHRFRLRNLRLRHFLAFAAFIGVIVAVVLLAPRIIPLLQPVYLSDTELRNDVCVKDRLNALGNVDIAGPILLGTFKERQTAFGEEAAYLESISRLVAAHSITAEGAGYVLHTAFWSGSAASDALAFAALCQRGGTEACRIREFRLRNSISASQAALIAFENTVSARTRLRECHRSPL